MTQTESLWSQGYHYGYTEERNNQEAKRGGQIIYQAVDGGSWHAAYRQGYDAGRKSAKQWEKENRH